VHDAAGLEEQEAQLREAGAVWVLHSCIDTEAVLVSPLPASVNVTGLELPAVAEPVMLEMDGAALMVNGAELEMMPLAVTTWIEPLPAALSAAEGMVAVMVVAFEYANVASGEVAELNVQVTVSLAAKPVPVMVMARLPRPAVAALVERLLMAGAVHASFSMLASTEPKPVTSS